MQVFTGERIFTGREWFTQHAIVVKEGAIERLIPVSELNANMELKRFDTCLVVPGFVDAQVYGAANKLFSVYPQTETLRLMNEEFIKQGCCLFLPTLATNTMGVFKKGIDAVRAYWRNNGKGVYGLHLEGPWLNEVKRGAHVKEWIHSPTKEEVEEILEYGKGVIKMITIAPEVCSDDVIELILSHHIILSAGHSNAGFSEAIKSFNKGVTAVTHLYNAMSPLLHREPGLVGASFNHDKVMASIIPDGHHVNYEAIAIAKKQMGHRLFAITDAVTETNEGPYQHHLAGDKYECNGVLSGSALSMHKAFTNLVRHLNMDVGEALRMCSLYPAQVLGCDDRYGKIAPQTAGQFLVLDKQLEIVEVITL